MKKIITRIGSLGFVLLVGLFVEILFTIGEVVVVPLWEWHWIAVLMQIAYVLTLLWIWVNLLEDLEKK